MKHATSTWIILCTDQSADEKTANSSHFYQKWSTWMSFLMEKKHTNAISYEKTDADANARDVNARDANDNDNKARH